MIKSLLDTDLYKLTMQQAILHNFPTAKAKYLFINRGKTPFSNNTRLRIESEVLALRYLGLTGSEFNWLKSLHKFSDDYIDWLKNYRFNPLQVSFNHLSDNLEISIEGPWVETILWEVPLMAIISNSFFIEKAFNDPLKKELDFEKKICEKAELFSENGVKWSDFGTRRRFNSWVQERVVGNMRNYKGFIGTSNLYFAKLFEVDPIGTYAHEAIMGMQALYGAKEANRKWMELWLKEFNGNMTLALSDTFTTKAFLKDFTFDLANSYTGVRQDSGNPFEIGEMVINHYKSLGIDPKTKTLVFSDNLNPQKVLDLHSRFKDEINVVFGIGTNLTNDVGYKPLNMVIKLVAADFGSGYTPVIKLSDDEGKHTGDPVIIAKVKEELGV